ncbi:hypothetical protein HN587_06620 [Candidatus Woesearchaeota archaeon]|nr:hypothetical protein [Candidatus Woesearchaeota archaeon]
MEKTMPVKVFKVGAISASIWVNKIQKDGKEFAYSTISLERNYKDREGQWKKTNSMRLNDIPKATLILNKSYEYLAMEHPELAQMA